MIKFQEFSLEIIFNDRMGFIADVTKLLADCGLNITSTELKKSSPHHSLYVGADSAVDISETALFRQMQQIPDLVTVQRIQTLPHVEREMRYKVVLDSISDGIISIDQKGKITTMNRVAGEIANAADVASLIGSDVNMLGLNVESLNQTVAKNVPIHITEDIETAKGRFRYLSGCQPISDDKGRVIGAVEVMKSVKEIQDLADVVSGKEPVSFQRLSAESESMMSAIEFARKVSVTDSFILLRGESGTGKEVFANAIHLESGRSGRFVPVNCAALPENLLESELFGFVGGSFTGADQKGKAGLFEHAVGGTLFLDEIAELPLPMQAKLLRVLQDKKIRRVGGNTEIAVDVRLICATNQNLENLVSEGLFREDLYYRINVFPIFMPPLRSRKEDISVLASGFLNSLSHSLNGVLKTLSHGALSRLKTHDWPGNVRELKNVMERAYVFSETDVVEEGHLFFSDRSGGSSAGTDGDPLQMSLKSAVGDYEKQLVEKALQAGGSIRETARRLQISHVALLNKIKKYGLNQTD